MKLPPMPSGISRSEAEPGKPYYTRSQMMEYGQQCADAERSRIEEDVKLDAKNARDLSLFGEAFERIKNDPT